MLQPRLKMPLWAAVAIPAAAYVVRSAVRGTVAPDLPADAIVFGALVLLLVLAASAGTAARRSDGRPHEELDHEHRSEGGTG